MMKFAPSPGISGQPPQSTFPKGGAGDKIQVQTDAGLGDDCRGPFAL